MKKKSTIIILFWLYIETGLGQDFGYSTIYNWLYIETDSDKILDILLFTTGYILKRTRTRFWIFYYLHNWLYIETDSDKILDILLFTTGFILKRTRTRFWIFYYLQLAIY